MSSSDSNSNNVCSLEGKCVLNNNQIYYLGLPVGILSILASLVVLITLYYSKELKRNTFFQILFIVFSYDIFDTVALLLMPIFKDGSFCQSGYCHFQGFYHIWGDNSVLFLSVFVSHYLYQLMVKRISMKFFDSKYFWRMDFFLLICLFIPIVMAIILLCLNAYGSIGFTCWISNIGSNISSNEMETLIYIFYTAPVVLVIVHNLIMTLIIFYHVRNQVTITQSYSSSPVSSKMSLSSTLLVKGKPDQNHKILKVADHQLLLPLFQIFIFLPTSIVFFFNSQNCVAGLYIILRFTSPINGFLSFLLYAYKNAKLRHFWKRLFMKWIYCRSIPDEKASTMSTVSQSQSQF